MPAKVLHLILPEGLRTAAAQGALNIVTLMAAALADFGWRLDLRSDSPGRVTQGWVMHYMQEPRGPREVCLRPAYRAPFWRIERTNERWHFDIAQAAYDPQAVDPGRASVFFRRWRGRILGAAPVTRDGFLLMPLQGQLHRHRSFQSMSPLDMIGQTLTADPRPVVATLHPAETHDSQVLRRLDDLAARNPRFRLDAGASGDLLSVCDMVVTQNSSVALTGYFAKKPAVLFAGIDFHHIAGSVPQVGVAAAFARATGPRPDFARYLYWFHTTHCINGGSPEAGAQIIARLRACGWVP